MIGVDNKGCDNEVNQYSSRSTFDFAEANSETIDDEQNSTRKSALDRTLKKLKSFKKEQHLFLSRTKIVFLNAIVVGYFAWATFNFFESKKKNELSSNLNQTNETEVGTCGVRYCGIQWCDGYGMLIILLAFTYIGLVYYQLKRLFGKQIAERFHSIGKRTYRVYSLRLTKIVLIVMVTAAFASFIIFDTIDSRGRLQSLIGIGVLLAFGFIFSASPTKIRLRPVICGFALQLLLGVICIRWEVGRSIFKCLGDKAARLLSFSLSGSTFVYGEFLSEVAAVFAFAVLPVIFFVSFIISILYYVGAMQWFILKLGWVLQVLIGTTICESLTCAANIFLGMSESPLLIKPYIKYLTRSEIHVVMSSGFATVSGSVLAAYISYGAEPAHLVTSSVMAAPAALCFAKLFYPETEESKTNANNIQLEKSTDSSILDAASNGANAAISLILGICANIVAFVAFVAFLNAFVSWLFILIGYEDITFEWIFSKLFIPLAWIIGIEWEDCDDVAKLIATKTIINEFVAYERLGKMKEAQEISLRSAAIATFAICGFANPSSLGIMIGSLSAMCPEKRPDITSVAVRAFISGSIICFINASIAGLLMTSDNFEALSSNNRTINILAGEHLTPEYLEMNPQHTIPTLDDNGDIMWDSQAICTYLIDKYAPNDDLYPRDLYTRARINQRLYFVSGVFYPKMIMINAAILFGRSTEFPQAGIHGINEAYGFLEKFLKNDSYLVGNAITVADYCCVAAVSTIQYAAPIDSDTFPKIAEWFERMKTVSFYDEINGKNVELFEQLVLGALETNRTS